MSPELSSLESAVGALGRALQVQEAVNAGVIQSFEVAYKQSWKMVKRWLENNVGATDVDGVARRHLFRLAAQAGLISDVDLWMTFHQARNETSHTYNCGVAASVLEMAPDFLAACEALVATLSTRND